MRKIVSIIGARPQFIKHSPLHDRLSEYFKDTVIHTGQHYDDNMSEIFFREMNIEKPDYNLHIGSKSHAVQTGMMMKGIEEILNKIKPACVIVYGDTNSTVAGSLTAAKMQIPVVHIEAGLRSCNMEMPEEINRVITDRLSFINFAPTKEAVRNLKNEGLTGIYSGDVMYDAFLKYSAFAEHRDISCMMPLKTEEFALLTIHRASNTEPVRLRKLLKELDSKGVKMVFPVHPRTAAVIDKLRAGKYKNIHMIKPLGYIDMLAMIQKASAVITDSGGLQKEAYWASRQCITLRPETEWTETLKHGRNILCPDAECIITEIIKPLRISNPGKHYGNGNASKMIAEILEEAI